MNGVLIQFFTKWKVVRATMLLENKQTLPLTLNLSPYISL